MNNYKIDIYKNEDLFYSNEVSISEQMLMEHPMVPTSVLLFISKNEEKVEFISQALLKDSNTDVYQDADESFFYFNSISGQKESLSELSSDMMKNTVGSYNPWVRGNLDITSCVITKLL